MKNSESRGGQGLRRDVQEGLHLQGQEARLLVPARRDRSGRGRDRVRRGLRRSRAELRLTCRSDS